MSISFGRVIRASLPNDEVLCVPVETGVNRNRRLAHDPSVARLTLAQ